MNDLSMRLNTVKIKTDIIIGLICFLLAFLFTYTAVSKLGNHDGFVMQLFKAPVIGKYREIVSWMLPISELIVAILLVFKTTQLTALYISLGMLVLFTIYLGWMLLFSKNLPCNCGGVINKMTWKQHIVFNLGFIVLAMLGIVLTLKNSRKYFKYNTP